MVSHDEHIPNKKKKEKHNKTPKSEPSDAGPSEDGCTYGIDRLNLGKTVYDSESDPR